MKKKLRKVVSVALAISMLAGMGSTVAKADTSATPEVTTEVVAAAEAGDTAGDTIAPVTDGQGMPEESAVSKEAEVTDAADGEAAAILTEGTEADTPEDEVSVSLDEADSNEDSSKEEAAQDTENTNVTTLDADAVYETVEVEGVTYIIYQGEMYRVVAEAVEAGDSHGDVETESITADLSIRSGKDVYDEEHLLLYRAENTSSRQSGDYEFWYAEQALESTARVNCKTTDGKSKWTKTALLFELVDESNNKYYAYCADFDTDSKLGYGYNIENVEDAGYYDETAAAQIKAIALNGYWATESGVGSLAAVKELLTKENEAKGLGLTEEEIASLTEGAALTATQAALWKYGNSGQYIVNDDDITGKRTVQGNKDGFYVSDAQKKLANALYQVLTNMDTATVEDSTTTLITENNFATADKTTIRVTNKEGDTYTADLSFTLEVQPSMVNDDLIVKVLDENENVIKTVRLAGDDSTTGYGVVTAKDGVYTIEGLEIASGAVLTLNLEGVQKLDYGVYLYKADAFTTTQTMVGVSEGTRTVNLKATVTFEAKELPDDVKDTSTDNGTQPDGNKDNNTDDNKPSGNTDNTDNSQPSGNTDNTEKENTTSTETGTPATTVPNTTPAENTTTPVTTTPSEVATTPATTTPAEDTATVDIAEEDVPLASAEDIVAEDETTKEEAALVDVEDSAVPLADGVTLATEATQGSVPKTGDMTFAWMVLSLISGMTLLGLAVARMRRENAEK